MAMTGDAYGFLRRCALEHGDTFTLRLEGWDPLVVFSHPEGLREVFAAHPDDLHVGTAEAFLAAIVGGEGSLFTVDGASHLDRRRGLTPAFAPGRNSLHGRLVAEAIRSATRWWPPPQPVAIHQAMEEVSRQVIVRALLGLDPGEPRLVRSCELVGELVRAMVAVVGWEEVSRDPAEVTAELDAIVFDEIAARRAGRRSAGGSDVLQILVDRRGGDGAMSDQEVRDLLLTLIVAGTDTTGSAMAWALLLLARHPAARDRLLAEIDGLGPEPDPEALAALPYAHAVACEVLRVRPVTPLAFTRRVERPIRLRNAVAGMHRRHRHDAGGRGDAGAREQPAGEQRLGQWNRRRKPARDTQYLEPVGQARTGSAMLFRHPGQGQPGVDQGLPQRRFPAAVMGAVDGLGIAEVREDPRRCLGDDVSALAHGISLLGWRVHSFGVGYWRPIVVGTPRIGKRRGSRSSPCAPLSRTIPG